MSEVWSAWDFRDRSSVAAGTSLVGYTVVATDGEVGQVVEATTEAGTSSLVVDTGPGATTDRIMLPAGTVERIDDAQKRVEVGRTRSQIQGAPEFRPEADDPKYRDLVADYYGGYYWTAPSSAVSEQARERATEHE